MVPVEVRTHIMCDSRCSVFRHLLSGVWVRPGVTTVTDPGDMDVFCLRRRYVFSESRICYSFTTCKTNFLLVVGPASSLGLSRVFRTFHPFSTRTEHLFHWSGLWSSFSFWRAPLISQCIIFIIAPSTSLVVLLLKRRDTPQDRTTLEDYPRGV